MLTPKQVETYHEQGFLHIPDIFEPSLLAAMRDDLHWMIEKWADTFPGWSGPWRKAYMDDDTEAKSMLIAMHELQWYSQAWNQAVNHPKLCDAMADILGPDVEFHHTTMHVKPPETGHPFPMHQDAAFYLHQDDRYIDVLAHLDDTSHENGEIRFIPGSHKQGFLKHITEWDGQPCTPHLDWNDYTLEDTVPVPANAGDIVIFNIYTIHGSHINQTNDMRRMVRMGYKHPDNRQLTGSNVGRPGQMVRGRRPRLEGDALFSICGPKDEADVQSTDALLKN